MVIGYVKILLACLRDLSASIEGNSLVYQKTSQFANEMAASESCGPDAHAFVNISSIKHLQRKMAHQAAQTRASSSHSAGHARPRLPPSTAHNTAHALRPRASAPLNSVSAIRSLDIRTRPPWVALGCAHACLRARQRRRDTARAGGSPRPAHGWRGSAMRRRGGKGRPATAEAWCSPLRSRLRQPWAGS